MICSMSADMQWIVDTGHCIVSVSNACWFHQIDSLQLSLVDTYNLSYFFGLGYNPELISEGKNPFILDSKKLRKEVTSFLKREGRFINLKKAHPEIANELFQKMNTGKTIEMPIRAILIEPLF